jgi:hypothetical protein
MEQKNTIDTTAEDGAGGRPMRVTMECRSDQLVFSFDEHPDWALFREILDGLGGAYKTRRTFSSGTPAMSEVVRAMVAAMEDTFGLVDDIADV